MFVVEYKVRQPKSEQIASINEAIRTLQFVRNKTLRYWIDNKDNGKAALFRYCTALRKEHEFVEHLNSTACQIAVERVLVAVNKSLTTVRKRLKEKKVILNSRKTTAAWSINNRDGNCQMIESV